MPSGSISVLFWYGCANPRPDYYCSYVSHSVAGLRGRCPLKGRAADPVGPRDRSTCSVGFTWYGSVTHLSRSLHEAMLQHLVALYSQGHLPVRTTVGSDCQVWVPWSTCRDCSKDHLTVLSSLSLDTPWKEYNLFCRYWVWGGMEDLILPHPLVIPECSRGKRPQRLYSQPLSI